MGLAERALDEQPVQPARRVPADAPTRRIGRRLGDTERVQTGRRDDALVVAVVRDDHGPVDAECVEVGSGRHEAVVEVAPPDAAHPRRVGLGRGLGDERTAKPFDVADAREVGPPRVQRRDAQVRVRVDEPGHERSTSEIHLAGGRIPGRQRGGTDRDDPLVFDHDCLGARAGRVHRQDRPAREEGDRHAAYCQRMRGRRSPQARTVHRVHARVGGPKVGAA